MTVWFTSDTHFRHANILNLGDGRPFVDIYKHDEILIRNWNAFVMPDDIVYHLGDVALGPWPEGLECVKRLNGYKILVPGNHDRIASFEKPARRERFMPDYEDAFQEITTETISIIGVFNVPVRASHYPYTGESEAGRSDRYEELRPINYGEVLIHGHTHSSDIISYHEDTLQISVGVDANNWTPVHQSTIQEWINVYNVI